MQKNCENCGTAFDAKLPSARYCSARCRMQVSRRKKALGTPVTEPAASREQAPEAVSSPPRSVSAAARAELEAAGRLDSAVGVAVLALARRIDGAATSETGAGLAALVKEFRATFDAALADAESAADPLDELRARRERRLSAG